MRPRQAGKERSPPDLFAANDMRSDRLYPDPPDIGLPGDMYLATSAGGLSIKKLEQAAPPFVPAFIH